MDIIMQNKSIEDFRIYGQKMELLVSLSNEVAHSFNNILQTIRSNTELIIAQTDEDDKRLKLLEGIYLAVKKGKDLTSRLNMLGKNLEPTKQKIYLCDEIKRITPILRRNLPENIELEVISPQRIQPISMDPFQLEQLLLHLVLNSKDAIVGKGIIAIEIQNEGDSVILSVTDSGKGIPNEIKPYIFNPFFTTKSIEHTRMGLSTGLGLYIVDRIIKANNGSIAVDSDVGLGTTFIIRIPALREGNTKKELEEGCGLSVGDESILIVDDDDEVRKSSAGFMEFFGYTVLVAYDIDSGLDALRNNKVDLVLLDAYLTTNKDAMDFILPAKKIDPNIKIIVMSGYDMEYAIKDKTHIDGFLHKPYFSNDALKIIREVLDKH
jgi:two-component system cell cycle sensor histidine kinase/response regulator CckA